jgi:hypothetical protein
MPGTSSAKTRFCPGMTTFFAVSSKSYFIASAGSMNFFTTKVL